MAAGNNDSGQCNVSDWRDIVAISAGETHTVGLKSDGTTVAVGNDEYGKCDVSGWSDIVAVSVGSNYTVGLKSNGTVVAAGWSGDGQCDVSDWRDIMAVSAGSAHTVGLKSDGTVVAVGNNGNGQCNVSDWRDIVAISAGDSHTVGLKSDGTVVAVGSNDETQCNVSALRDIRLPEKVPAYNNKSENPIEIEDISEPKLLENDSDKLISKDTVKYSDYKDLLKAIEDAFNNYDADRLVALSSDIYINDEALRRLYKKELDYFDYLFGAGWKWSLDFNDLDAEFIDVDEYKDAFYGEDHGLLEWMNIKTSDLDESAFRNITECVGVMSVAQITRRNESDGNWHGGNQLYPEISMAKENGYWRLILIFDEGWLEY